MSVDLQREIERAGLDVKVFVTTPRWIASVRFVAGALRDIGLQVGFDPIDVNPFHGQVWGAFTRAQQDAMRSACEWLVRIEGVEIDDGTMRTGT